MHRSLFLTVFTAVAVMATALAMPAGAGPVMRCAIKSTQSGVEHGSLQAAVDAAPSGDTLIVKGTCVGHTLIDGKDLTVRGRGGRQAPATLDAGDASTSTVSVWGGARVTIRDLEITGGSEGISTAFPSWLTVTRSRITGNGAGITGYAILSISRSTIANNDGTGVVSLNTLEITDSVITENSLGVAGISATLDIRKSVVSDNTAGGVEVGLGSAIVMDSIISGNTSSANGGGIFNSGALTITDSLVTGNAAAGFGGGIYNWPGIPNDPFFIPGRLTVKRTTITENTATSGGGIYTESPITLLGSKNVLCPNTPNDPLAPCT